MKGHSFFELSSGISTVKTGEKQLSKKKTAGFISEVEQKVIKNTNYKIVNWVLSLKRFYFFSQVLKHFDPWVPHGKKKFINFVSLGETDVQWNLHKRTPPIN